MTTQSDGHFDIPTNYTTYHAYAFGASPPGPGKISSNFASVSSSSVISVARTALSSCSIVRGPIIGAVTTGLCNNMPARLHRAVRPSHGTGLHTPATYPRFSSTRFTKSGLLRRPLSTFSKAPPSRPPPADSMESSPSHNADTPG